MNVRDEQTGTATGTVEWFDPERGVGAIRPDDGTPHCTGPLRHPPRLWHVEGTGPGNPGSACMT